MPARFAEVGDLHAAVGEQAFSLDSLLELSAKHERDHGEADLPYPPEYPKMPGEPKRVQPSKDRTARRTTAAEPGGPGESGSE